MKPQFPVGQWLKVEAKRKGPAREAYGYRNRKDTGQAMRESIKDVMAASIIRPGEAKKLVEFGVKSGLLKMPPTSVLPFV